MATNEKSLDPEIMSQFHGSEHWYRHWVAGITFTDGAKYVADAAGAYWLDEIALAQRYIKAVAAEEFQAGKLTVKPDSTPPSPARTATTMSF